MGHAELQPEDIDETISAFRGAFKRTWWDFCATTSIHGLKFTREDQTNKYIRIFWFVLTLVMFSCAITMVIRFYTDYRSNPTRLNVENDHAPISSLHFPSVTVCPDILYNMEKTVKYLDKLKMPTNVTANDVVNNMNILQGFQTDDTVFSTEVVQMMESVLTMNNITVVDFVEEVHWTCSDMITSCRYMGQIVDCLELFTEAFSFMAHCCAFNVIQPKRRFTARYSFGGHYGGLSLILKHRDSLYQRVRSYSNGFQVLISENAAFPSAHSIIKFAPLYMETFVSLQTVEVLTSQAVKDLNSEERMCVLPDEFEMRYFQNLSTGHCELNCRMVNMMKYCGCILYFFDLRDTKDPICSFKDVPCLVGNFSPIVGRFVNTQCSCPMRCERIDFTGESMNTRLIMDATTIDTFYNRLENNSAVVHIYHEAEIYRRLRRDLLSNMVTLVSNLGSAFSLFVGMSLVSAVEILYYFTVILRKHYKQELKAREKILFNKTAKAQ